MKDSETMVPATVNSSRGSRQLLIQLPIQRGETLRSYLARAAQANTLGSDEVLMRQCSSKAGSTYTGAWFDQLSSFVGQPAGLLARTHFRTFGPLYQQMANEVESGNLAHLTYSRGHESFDHVRGSKDVAYCPECLAEAAYERAWWAPLYSLYCTKHESYLLLRCASCKNALTAGAVAVDMCLACGTTLSKTVSMRVPPDARRLACQSLLDSLWGNPAVHRPPDLPKADNRSLYMVLHGLTRMLLVDNYLGLPLAERSWFKRIVRSPQPLAQEALAQTLMLVFDALADWPDGFHSFLDTFARRTGEPYGEVILQDFGSLYSTYFETQWSGAGFEFVQRVLDDYIVENYQFRLSTELLKRYRESSSFRNRFAYISIQEAARRLAVPTAKVKKLVADKRLHRAKDESLPPDEDPWLYASEVDQLLEAPSVLADQGLANWYYVGPLDHAERMIADGIAYAADEGMHPKTIVVEGEVMRAVKIPRGRKRLQKGPTISAAQTLELLGPYGLSLGRLTNLVLSGEIASSEWFPAVSSTKDVDLSLRDVRRLQSNLAKEHLADAARKLADKLETTVDLIYVWVEAGLFDQAKKMQHSPLDLTVEEVKAFRRTYVGFPEASRLTGLSERTLRKHVKRGRLRQVAVPGSNRHSSLLYRVNVEAWSVDKTITLDRLIEEYDISSVTVEHYVLRGLLLPICGPGVDRRRKQRFVRREVERCLRLHHR